jgi:hypothetical protein
LKRNIKKPRKSNTKRLVTHPSILILKLNRWYIIFLPKTKYTYIKITTSTNEQGLNITTQAKANKCNLAK